MNDVHVARASHALVVGVARYLHEPELPAGVRAGAEAIATVLSDPLLGGFPAEQVRLLTDAEVTRESLLEELATLGAAAGPDATLVVYFAGHGGSPAGSAETWLLPHDADGAGPHRLAATAVSGAELGAALAALPARRVYVAFDCCHADGVLDGAAGGVLARGLPESWCAELGAGRGRVVLASARSDERSWVTGRDEPSVFTRHLLGALRGGAEGTAGWIRAFSLFEYLQPRVTGERPDQHPVFKADLEENFPVALYLGGRRDPREAAREDEPPFHAYVSYADADPDDARRVWETLVPRLREAGLRIAVSGDVEEPGVARVVGAERGILRARRTVLVLSHAYLEDRMAGFVDALAQTIGVDEGVARLLPVRFGPLDTARLPARLRSLVTLDLAHPYRGERELDRLVSALHAPAPRAATPV